MLITIGFSGANMLLKNRKYTILLVIKKSLKINNKLKVWQREQR
jgi:hypothetical protein